MSEFTDSLRITASSDHGEGSLRWALEIAAKRECSVLEIDPSVSRIELDQPLPVIVSNLKLEGNGVIISGAHSCRIFRIDAGNVALSDLRLIDGLARGEAGTDGVGGDAGMGALFIAAGEFVSAVFTLLETTLLVVRGGRCRWVARFVRAESDLCHALKSGSQFSTS